MLSLADGSYSSVEEAHLADLANRLVLPQSVTESVRLWVRDYGNLLERLDGLLSEPDANATPGGDGET